MPPKENPERACEECIHFFACSRQCGEPMAQRSATGCECYETIKSSMAYYVGTLDGAKGKIPNRLRELVEADKDGRVVVLPCKGADKLYVVGTKQIVECNVAEKYLMDDETIEYLVNFECVDNCDGCPFNSWQRETVSDEYHCGGEYGDGSVSSKDFGKTVFLTREEAERALEVSDGKRKLPEM